MKRKRKFAVSPDPLPPAVSPEEARDLAAEIIRGHAARERLVEGSLRTVAHVAGQLLASEDDRLHGLQGEDLYSAGCDGLVKAIDRLRDNDNPPAYLRKCVEGAIKDAITEHAKDAILPLSDLVKDFKDSQCPGLEAAVEHDEEGIIETHGGQHKEYLRLRLAGMTIAAAAEKIGRAPSSMGDWERRWVREIRTELYERRRFSAD